MASLRRPAQHIEEAGLPGRDADLAPAYRYQRAGAANDNKAPPLLIFKRLVLLALIIAAAAWLLGLRPS